MADRERRSIRARAPKASTPRVRKLMRANAGSTKPEIALRSALFAFGLRYRKNARPEAGYKCTADVVFRRAKVCVFLDGCYWHGCEAHFAIPKTNGCWWAEKIADNTARDARQSAYLTAKGWLVLRFWEHEDLKAAAIVVANALAGRNNVHAASLPLERKI